MLIKGRYFFLLRTYLFFDPLITEWLESIQGVKSKELRVAFLKDPETLLKLLFHLKDALFFTPNCNVTINNIPRGPWKFEKKNHFKDLISAHYGYGNPFYPPIRLQPSSVSLLCSWFFISLCLPLTLKSFSHVSKKMSLWLC